MRAVLPFPARRRNFETKADRESGKQKVRGAAENGKRDFARGAAGGISAGQFPPRLLLPLGGAPSSILLTRPNALHLCQIVLKENTPSTGCKRTVSLKQQHTQNRHGFRTPIFVAPGTIPFPGALKISPCARLLTPHFLCGCHAMVRLRNLSPKAVLRRRHEPGIW